jgi:hypothetical protein
MKRYQECNRLEKLWRCRWYLLLPFKWFWCNYIKPIKIIETKFDENHNLYIRKDEIGWTPKGKMLWSILVGTTQTKMNWYYTMEEVREHITRLKSKK